MAPGSRRLEAKAFIPGLGEVASAQSTTAELTCASPKAAESPKAADQTAGQTNAGTGDASSPKSGGCNTSGQSGPAGSSLFLTSLAAALVIAARRRNARA
jgi:MYXO-CTERM domain-containing protein